MNFYLKDVLTQTQELEQAIEYYQSSDVCDTLDQISKVQPKKVVFSGMGSSHFCSIAASIYLKSRGIECEVISAGELLYYESEILNRDTLLVLISQSGESAEIVHMIQKLPKDVMVVAITNQMSSTLANRGDFSFDLHVAQEKSVTTRTYLGSVVLVQLIAETLCHSDRNNLFKNLKHTIGYLRDYLEDYDTQMVKLKSFAKEMQYLCILGRGYALETVQAGALFMREVLRFPALDFDCAEFRHGPMEMVQSDFHGIVLAPTGETQVLNIKMASDIAEKDGKVILITDTNGDTKILEDRENILIIKLPVVEEWLSPILQIAPIQLLANVLAEERNIPVGEFRWGSKVMVIE
jgi:glucosamine--fructose-6-phosphate aminotransferase (isomerizing)